MIEYKYNNETGIVETSFNGTLEIKDIVEYINKLGKDTSLPANLRIFTDARKTIVNFNLKSLGLILEAINCSEIKHESIREAIIHDDPDVSAYSFIYQKMLACHKNHIFRIFCTEDAALKWLTE
jgi:hypothetical protein